MLFRSHEQALMGLGAAWLPHSLVRADLAAGRLVLADPLAAPTRFDVQLFHPRHATDTLKLAIWRATAQPN